MNLRMNHKCSPTDRHDLPKKIQKPQKETPEESGMERRKRKKEKRIEKRRKEHEARNE